MKLYKFTANSQLSFAVSHNGRNTYVTFSSRFRGVSSYFTTDEELAKIIRAHKWYREGRIKEVVEEMEPEVVMKESEVPKIPLNLKKNFMGIVMAGPENTATAATALAADDENNAANTAEIIDPHNSDSEKNDPIEENPDENKENPDEGNENPITAEQVTSFMEAKEYIVNQFGVERAQIKSKEAVDMFAKAHNISFPNYQI